MKGENLIVNRKLKNRKRSPALGTQLTAHQIHSQRIDSARLSHLSRTTQNWKILVITPSLSASFQRRTLLKLRNLQRHSAISLSRRQLQQNTNKTFRTHRRPYFYAGDYHGQQRDKRKTPRRTKSSRSFHKRAISYNISFNCFVIAFIYSDFISLLSNNSFILS